jgi:hypothetical protein
MRLLEENLAAEEEKKKADLGLSNNMMYPHRRLGSGNHR